MMSHHFRSGKESQKNGRRSHAMQRAAMPEKAMRCESASATAHDTGNGAAPEGFEEIVALSESREATFHSSDFGANQESGEGVAVMPENAPPLPLPARYDKTWPDGKPLPDRCRGKGCRELGLCDPALDGRRCTSAQMPSHYPAQAQKPP
jgi:hypothetical protein